MKLISRIHQDKTIKPLMSLLRKFWPVASDSHTITIECYPDSVVPYGSLVSIPDFINALIKNWTTLLSIIQIKAEFFLEADQFPGEGKYVFGDVVFALSRPNDQNHVGSAVALINTPQIKSIEQVLALMSLLFEHFINNRFPPDAKSYSPPKFEEQEE